MHKIIVCIIALISIQLVSAQFYGVATIRPLAQGSTQNPQGTVTFMQADSSSSVVVTVNISGTFEARNYAIHVHKFGDLSDTSAGTSAGGHYVGVGSTNHSCPDNGNNNRHEGDMGNWLATTTGIQQTKTLNLLTLTGNNSIVGRNVILHLMADDCVSQPSGAAGMYIGYGVIGIVNTVQAPDASGSTIGNTDATVATAVALLYPTNLATSFCGNSGCSGRVTFTQNPSDASITITATISGLTATTPRGFHVHTYGDLSTPATGLSVGSHWNPTNVSHALPNVVTRHLGDMGNVQSFDAAGNGYYSYTMPAAQFGSLTSVLGRAVVLHSGNDNGDGANCDQAGNSGSRILWGIIGAQNTNATLSPAINLPSISINNNYMAMPCSPSSSPTVSYSASPSRSSAGNLLSWVNVLAMF